jgi:hypothetical protein
MTAPGPSLRRFLRAFASLACLFAVPTIGSYAEGAQAVNWQGPVQGNNATVIPGVVRAPFGAFELRWMVEPAGKARLAYLDPAGSAELPLMEKSILILNNRDGTTALFQEWFPLLNDKKPSRLNEIAVVSTSSLFSVVAGSESPPAFSLGGSTRSIRWGQPSTVDGVKYRKGLAKAATGTIALAWRTASSGGAELYLMSDSRADAGKGDATRLYLWIHDEAQTAELLRVEPWRVNVLRPVITVPLKSLLSGL